MRASFVFSLGVSLIGLALARADEWPQFRGPGGTAQAEARIPTEWGPDKNIEWKVKVPGYAWSSPIIWGDKVFVTTAVSDKQTKPSGGGFGGGFGGGRPGGGGGRPPGGGGGGFGRAARPPDDVYRWEVHCLDRATGKTVWKQVAIERKPTIATHRTNTYASETPVTDGERVYAYFGMTGLFCFDMTGKQLWKKDLGSYSMQFGWGTGSSPVLEGNRLFVQCDNEEKSFLIALDKKTGDELWKVSRDERSSWSTPHIWRNKKRTELVASGQRKVRSYDPATGKVLWELTINSGGGGGGFGGGGGGGGGGFGGGRGGGGGNAAASPVGDEELLYVGSGGGFGGAGSPFAVKPGGSGDITPKRGEKTSDGVAWMQDRAGPSMASPLLYKGYLYIVEQRGNMLSCYDARTGKPAYSRERLTGARGFTSSPWGAGDKVYCLDDNGQTFVVEAGPKFKLLGKNSFDEMTWSSPAIAGNALFLRTVDRLYCIKQ